MKCTWRSLAVALLALTLSPALPAEWSGRNRIEFLQVLDGTGYVRLEITSTTNPAACLNNTFIDFQLDNGIRSSAEQQIILDAFQMALIMSQPVEFFIDDTNCSTANTSSSIRIATGFRIHRT
ncbi:MAG: hypothetical protein ABR558_02400 [Thioalkalivibrio sp.]